jgi:hypothetical protein
MTYERMGSHLKSVLTHVPTRRGSNLSREFNATPLTATTSIPTTSHRQRLRFGFRGVSVIRYFARLK